MKQFTLVEKVGYLKFYLKKIFETFNSESNITKINLTKLNIVFLI